jgi:hypothetical protein
MYDTDCMSQKYSSCHLLKVLQCLLFSCTVGSYFVLQWLANLLVVATQFGSICVQSATASTILYLFNLLATLGLSIIGTNLLCHRYLVEKARAMIKLYVTCPPQPCDYAICYMLTHPFVAFLGHGSIDDGNGPLTQHLEKLEGSLQWEARSLYIVAMGVPTFFIYEPAGFIIAGLAVLVVIVMVRSHVFALQIEIQSTQHHPLPQILLRVICYVCLMHHVRRHHHHHPCHPHWHRTPFFLAW